MDGYSNNYPLEYKHRFREVIAPEIEKNEEVRVYFDTWGNRCYLFNSITGNYMRLQKGNTLVYEGLEFDMEALRELGCEYLFSGAEIGDADRMGKMCIRDSCQCDLIAGTALLCTFRPVVTQLFIQSFHRLILGCRDISAAESGISFLLHLLLDTVDHRILDIPSHDTAAHDQIRDLRQFSGSIHDGCCHDSVVSKRIRHLIQK